MITTEQEYTDALTRYELLWDYPKGTPEGIEAHRLFFEIIEYEAKYHPVPEADE